MLSNTRIISALKASGLHFVCSVIIAGLAALLVFVVWYPYPYAELAGGRELFFLVISVDIVCGPLLTMVLFNPTKSRSALTRDLSLVVLIQLMALVFGLWTVWLARPLFLVLEIDRFKVIVAPDVATGSISKLHSQLKPRLFSNPITVGLREPDPKERKDVMIESVVGGRDYAERPEFYIPYESEAALKSLERAKPLGVFLQKYPEHQSQAAALAKEKNAELAQWFYLPVVARQDWVAILDKQGQIQGFLKGDGF